MKTFFFKHVLTLGAIEKYFTKISQLSLIQETVVANLDEDNFKMTMNPEVDYYSLSAYAEAFDTYEKIIEDTNGKVYTWEEFKCLCRYYEDMSDGVCWYQ